VSALEPARPPRDPRIPVSPQLALRVAIIGGVAMVMFGVIFFRLWYLQVLSGEQYVAQANANQVRELPVAAPRGKILGREGQTIATTVTTNAVQIVPSALPPAGAPRIALYQRLGALLGMSASHIQALVERGRTAVPYAPVTIKTDAGRGVLTVLGERQSEYPGVEQQPVSIRNYPYGEMAAQALGYVGEVSTPELEKGPFHGVQQGTVVGQEGLEYFYDHYLRGEPGVERVEVNAEGYPVPSHLAPTAPKAGYTLQTTLDVPLQREGEKALLEGIEHARAGGKPAVAGGFVALDPLNGEVLALGSYPSFNPNQLAKPITKAELDTLEGKGTEAPARLIDRAVNGTYPTGSTFKPITAMAALEAGVMSPGEGLGAGECIYVSTKAFCNSGHTDYGAVGLVEALKVSSDTYFFEVGERSFYHGNIIQDMAHKLGIGQETGIDLPSEIKGLVPDAKWREEVNQEEESCRSKHHGVSCEIVSEVRPWSVGDEMDLALGQGELLTDPLQMAVAYSTLANAYLHGGEGVVVTPHLGKQIDEADGGLLQSLSFPPKRHVHLNDEDLSLVMEGIHDAASEQGGTSADVWEGWNQEQNPVYGKTGTAEHAVGTEYQAWYMCFIDNPAHPIVIAVTVEQGGFGAETAAPVARLIASQWLHQPEKFVGGTSKTL
jgi:penicillin-binding protein 2